MAETLASQITLSFNAQLASTANALATAVYNLSQNNIGNISLTNGTGAGKNALLYSAAGTIASSSSTTLTLSALTDPLGNAVVFTKIRALFLQNTGNTGGAPVEADSLIMGAAATHAWIIWANSVAGAEILVPSPSATGAPNPFTVLTAPGASGYAVVATTTDQLKLANASGSNTIGFNIIIVGE